MSATVRLSCDCGDDCGLHTTVTTDTPWSARVVAQDAGWSCDTLPGGTTIDLAPGHTLPTEADTGYTPDTGIPGDVGHLTDRYGRPWTRRGTRWQNTDGGWLTVASEHDLLREDGPLRDRVPDDDEPAATAIPDWVRNHAAFAEGDPA
ncbi:hypothetical protein GCM10022243_49120 [Saccharothrix violaceirubra]|uniref:Uncharacterized protein n=1 Tax=Saccharothrix violaceirubra TaxID=413306 RepID=A0A7W7SZJ2_9PSEU|nr:hypothetical protein [Saccharothrix violaceirubra]MBB4963745.1 hypothetical protein [Saccharothrix violaceirubra]